MLGLICIHEPRFIVNHDAITRILRSILEDNKKLLYFCYALDFLRIRERMEHSSSGKRSWPESLLEDLFDCAYRLIKILCNHDPLCKRKFMKEIAERLP
jgi:hypothetical protein